MESGKEMKVDGCPFCSKIEPRSRIIEETKHTLTILSNPALVKGHCLIIPKRHVEKISELNEDEIKDSINQLIKMQKRLLKKFSGCDIRQNYRPFQKQNNLKVDHLHFHLLPRELEDELYKKCQIFEKEIFKELSQEELDNIKKEI